MSTEEKKGEGKDTAANTTTETKKPNESDVGDGIERGEESDAQRELLYLCTLGTLPTEKNTFRTTDVRLIHAHYTLNEQMFDF